MSTGMTTADTSAAVVDINSYEASVAWANDCLSGTDEISPLVSDDPPNIERCVSFPRDVMRHLMLVVFISQVFYFQYVFEGYYVQERPSWKSLRPLWWVTTVLTLGSFLLLVAVPRVYSYMFIRVVAFLWSVKNALGFTQPLGASSYYGLVVSTYGHSYIPYYGTWATYILLFITPRLSWMVFGTTDRVVGNLVPPTFLICTLILNLCMNISYLYNLESSDRGQAFEILYLTLQRTKKSILEILDAVSVLNELGQFQKVVTPTQFLVVAWPVTAIVVLLLLFITMEVHLKVTRFWTLDSLSTELQDANKDTRRYSRTGVLMFAVFLIIQILTDLVLLVFRLVAFLRGLLALTSFVFKNLIYLLIHSTHLYSLLMLPARYQEANYSTG